MGVGTNGDSVEGGASILQLWRRHFGVLHEIEMREVAARGCDGRRLWLKAIFVRLRSAFSR